MTAFVSSSNDVRIAFSSALTSSERIILETCAICVETPTSGFINVPPTV